MLDDVYARKTVADYLIIHCLMVHQQIVWNLLSLADLECIPTIRRFGVVIPRPVMALLLQMIYCLTTNPRLILCLESLNIKDDLYCLDIKREKYIWNDKTIADPLTLPLSRLRFEKFNMRLTVHVIVVIAFVQVGDC